MTQVQPKSALPLREVLYQFAMVKEVPDVELLDEFVRQYPHHAQALTDFAVEMVVESLGGGEAKAVAVATELSPAVSRAMSKFHNALYSVKTRATTSAGKRAVRTAVENPILKYQRSEFRQFVKDLRANPIFACKLRDGLIDVKTMTRGFVDHLARAMKEPIDSVVAFLDALTPSVPTGQFCKADDKPQAIGRQTFEEAVKSSSLTEEQQQFFLNL